MELLSRSGRIPSELIPTAIAWGQAMAVAIEAMFCQQPVIRKPPVMGGLLHSGVKATFPVAPLQSGSSSLDGSKIVTYPHPLNKSIRTNTTNTITPSIMRSRCHHNLLRVGSMCKRSQGFVKVYGNAFRDRYLIRTTSKPDLPSRPIFRNLGHPVMYC